MTVVPKPQYMNTKSSIHALLHLSRNHSANSASSSKFSHNSINNHSPNWKKLSLNCHNDKGHITVNRNRFHHSSANMAPANRRSSECMIGMYAIVCKIGSGSFGNVYKVRDIRTNKIYACKVMSRQLMSDNITFAMIEKEARIMERLSNPNIVQLYDIVYGEKNISLISEYCLNGSLYDGIIRSPTLMKDRAPRIASDIIYGLIYLHSRNIAHLDIKPENILFNSHNTAKIADFGSCLEIGVGNCLNLSSTPGYAAPEVMYGYIQQNNECKADIWSLGIVIYNILVGQNPWMIENVYETDAVESTSGQSFQLDFNHDNSPNQLEEKSLPNDNKMDSSFEFFKENHEIINRINEFYKEIEKGNYRFIWNLPCEAQHFVKSCLQYDPKNRPTAKQLLSMPFIQSNNEYLHHESSRNANIRGSHRMVNDDVYSNTSRSV